MWELHIADEGRSQQSFLCCIVVQTDKASTSHPKASHQIGRDYIALCRQRHSGMQPFKSKQANDNLGARSWTCLYWLLRNAIRFKGSRRTVR